MKKNTGQALIIAVIFFVTLSALMISSIAIPILRGFTQANAYIESKESFYLSQAGLEDLFLRIKTGMDFSNSENVVLGAHTATVEINNISTSEKEVIAEGNINNRVRRGRIVLRVGEGATFNFGVQTDTGGIVMENSSSVNGNVFSNGVVLGSGNNLANGDAISAGGGGLIEGVHVGGDAYAHSIDDTTVDGDAYFFATSTLTNSTVAGTEYPGSEDQGTSTLPITDEQVETWKSDAEAGGITNCTDELVINTNQTIGPQRYTCSVNFKNNPTIILAGAVWIEGDLTFDNNVTYRVDSALSGESVPVVIDNPADRETSSRVTFNNSGFFEGSDENSYIFIISQNESAKNGGSEKAITLKNGAQGDVVVYAGHGEILLQNNVDLKEVTAWRVRLQNNAEVTYESGLVNTLFTSGPGASFGLEDWEEVE